MAYARWQATITDEAGNIVPSAQVTVRAEVAGSPLARLYTDRAGTVQAANPITADANGFVYFHVTGGAYRITATKGAFSREWRYVGIGRNAESDLAGLRPQGAWDAEISYSSSDYIRHNERTFVSLVDENLGNEPPDAPEDSDVWMWVPLGENAELAIAARDLAQQWAAKPEDETVEDPVNGNGNSSFHWSKKSEAQANRSEQEANRAEDARNLAQGWASNAVDASGLLPRYATVATLLADTDMGYPGSSPVYEVDEGVVVEAGGFRYSVAASGATDQHVETAGGVKLYVLKDADGTYNASAFGAVNSFSTDSVAAINAAIQAHTDGFGVVRLPAGTVTVKSTIICDKQGITLRGSADRTTTLYFDPAGDDTCIFIGLGGEGTTDGGVLFQPGIEDLRITSPEANTYKKIAIDAKDVSLLRLENVSIGPRGRFNGGGSIGLRTRGREALSAISCNFAADNPIFIGYNPNFPSICADHFNFHNTYLQAENGYGNVEIEAGCTIYHLSFTGHQAWVRGSYGIKWHGGTAPAGISLNLSFENVRWEQPSSSGWFADIDPGGSNIEQLTFRNIYTPTGANGFKLRRAQRVTLNNVSCATSSLVALNLDSTFLDVAIENCWWQTGSTASLPAGTRTYFANYHDNSGPLPNTGHLDISTTSARRNLWTGGPIRGGTVSDIASGGGIGLPDIPSGFRGFVMFSDTSGGGAIFGVNQSTKATTKVSDVQSLYSNTKDTASMFNFYWNSTDSRYELQNNRGSAHSISFQMIGYTT